MPPILDDPSMLSLTVIVPISLPLILPPLSAASTSVAFSATLMSPCALLAVNLPSNVPTRSIEPVFVPMTALPCAPSAVPIFALPTVAFSALILPPLSVASISVAEVATLMSPLAFFAVNLPPRVPTSTEPVLLSITTFPVPDTATFSTVAVDSALDTLRSPPLSVALTAFADSETLTSFWASLTVNMPSMVETSILPVLESTVKSPLNPFTVESISIAPT